MGAEARLEVGYATTSRNEEAEPYRQLWAEVLRIAVLDASGHVTALHQVPANVPRDVASRRIAESAAAWFTSPRHSAGSFIWICNLLDLDPGAVRAALQKNNKGVKHEAGAHD